MKQNRSSKMANHEKKIYYKNKKKLKNEIEKNKVSLRERKTEKKREKG